MMCLDLDSEMGQFYIPKAIAHAARGIFVILRPFFDCP